MSIAVDLLKADHIGVSDFKEHLSAKFLNKLLVITDRGNPVSVNLPYSDVLELLDILDELTDPETIATIREGREAIKAGTEGIPVSDKNRKLQGALRYR
jgi:PHD/YefM family antitoxin component YafN of YafNO toxin-antitoxin module